MLHVPQLSKDLLLGAKGKASAVRDICIRSCIIFGYEPQIVFAFAFYPGEPSDSKSLWLQQKQDWKFDSILIAACSALSSYQKQVKTSLPTTMASPQELTGVCLRLEVTASTEKCNHHSKSWLPKVRYKPPQDKDRNPVFP